MVSPLFFPGKTGDVFNHHRLSLPQRHPYFSLKKTEDVFCTSLSLCLISLGCHPLEGVTRTFFLPIRHRSSTVLCKFSHNFFFIRVSPPGGFHPRRSLLVTPLREYIAKSFRGTTFYLTLYIGLLISRCEVCG